MKKIDLEHSSRPEHGKALCWAARIVSLLPGTAATAYAAYVSMRWPAAYGSEGPLFFFAILALPGLIAWRWHLTGGLLIVFSGTMFVSYCIVWLPYESVVFYYLVWPSAMVFFAGGVLHLVVAERDRQSYVSSKGSVLSWTARLVSVGAWILAGWWTLRYCHYALDWHSGMPASCVYVPAVFFGLVPMLLVAIAWRWRLAGGIAMLGYVPVLFLGATAISLASEGHRDVSHLYVATLLFLIGAVLHLTQRWCENRSQSCRKTQSSRPSSGISTPGCP
ncbi:MAG: hypothetical protein A2Y72_05465 [Chloroflexi bacterium RBG_13_53_26]|nr:MAG: hypothetical protein A2Y72_05465 [Chloroflexi bacterium RBG_13_53_26]